MLCESDDLEAAMTRYEAILRECPAKRMALDPNEPGWVDKMAELDRFCDHARQANDAILRSAVHP